MRKVIDWEKGLSYALAKSLENTGSCGVSGARAEFFNNDGDFSGTALATVVTTEPPVVTSATVPVTTGNQSDFRQDVGGGYQETQHLQSFSSTVTTGTTVTTQIDDGTDERAAIVEFEAGVPRTWAEGFASLDRVPVAGFSGVQWRQIVDDGGIFLDAWGVRANTLGWVPADVFGLYPPAPSNADDAVGLVFLIGGGEVTGLSEYSALIRRDGSWFVYSRRSHTAWELKTDEASS